MQLEEEKDTAVMSCHVASPSKSSSFGRNSGTCKTHNIHVPLFAALHVLCNGVSLFLGDLQSLPQLRDTDTVGHTRRFNLRFPSLQLKPRHDTQF